MDEIRDAINDHANWLDKYVYVPPPNIAETIAIIHGFTEARVVTFSHMRGRLVIARVYLIDGLEIMGDVVALDLNTIEVSFSQPLTGTLVLI